jgi:hypothetical protein
MTMIYNTFQKARIKYFDSFLHKEMINVEKDVFNLI